MKLFRAVPAFCLALGLIVPACWSPTVLADDSQSVVLDDTAKLTIQGNDAGSDDVKMEIDENQVEVIRVRYPNRRVKIERHVTQDAQRNYINQGPWTMWDPQGTMLGKGQYRYGKLHGKWIRWFVNADPKQFTGRLYEGFEQPFVQEATFIDGQVHGEWKTFDAKNRKISSWSFERDQLHGKVTWWHPSGRKSREENYRYGILDGNLMKWKADGSELSKDTYKAGRKFARYVKTNSAGDKLIEGYYLHAAELTQTSYDWWNGTIKIELVGKEGAKEREGNWIYWHSNGGRHFEGNFEKDRPVGQHIWWYPNGQKRLAGEFLNGKQHGPWVWWYANGQKYIEGHYVAGVQTGTWIKWQEDGRVVEVQEDPDPNRREVADQGIDDTDTAGVQLAERSDSEQPPAELEVGGSVLDFTDEDASDTSGTSTRTNSGLPSLPTLSPTRRL